MALHDYFRGDRPWAQLYRFLGRLPRHGHFNASVMDDDDDVSELLRREQPGSFGLVGWTHERELLTAVVESVNALQATLIAVNSEDGKPPKVTPLPRPVTAVERIEEAERHSMHSALVALVLPNGPQPLT